MGNKRMEFNHYPVMLNETIDFLDIKKEGIYIDCTLGGGGHTGEILKRLGGTGKLIAIDRDLAAVENAKNKYRDDRLSIVHGSFGNLDRILETNNIFEIDGLMMDLGMSSYQIDNPSRGFSYIHDAPLDMRMDNTESFTAFDLVNEYTEGMLTEIFFKYGEERYTRRIVSKIIEEREKAAIETTGELAAIIASAVPPFEKGGHPAKRVFQAIRIEVNNELKQIEPALEIAVDKLKIGGRIAVISFHSLEDTIVKQTFKRLAKGCICPRDFPICACGIGPSLKILTRKPQLPSKEELKVNSRSKSAKLRAAVKI